MRINSLDCKRISSNRPATDVFQSEHIFSFSANIWWIDITQAIQSPDKDVGVIVKPLALFFPELRERFFTDPFNLFYRLYNKTNKLPCFLVLIIRQVICQARRERNTLILVLLSSFVNFCVRIAD